MNDTIDRRVPLMSVEVPSKITGGTGEVIAARQSTHGVFKENTVFMQAMKDLMRQQPNWQNGQLEPYQKEFLDMVAHKLGRILHGDPKFEDHYIDISGYADRVVKTIKGDLSP